MLCLQIIFIRFSMTTTILLLSIVHLLGDSNKLSVENYSLLRGWKHSDSQKLCLTAGRGGQKKPVGTMFRTKYSGKAYRHNEHLLESLKGLNWKGASRRGKTDDAFYVCLLLLSRKIFKNYSLKRVIYFWLFYHSPCHWCVFWYLFLLLNVSTCSKVSNAPVSVFLMLTYSVQSSVKSVTDILHSSTPKSNEKLFYSHTYLLTVYFTKRKFSQKRTESEKVLKLLLRIIFIPLGFRAQFLF